MSESEPGTYGVSTRELLIRGARKALEYQRADGSFPPGRNYTYDEPETPVRTTSHWLETLSSAVEATGDEAFVAAANDAADYLLSGEVRPDDATFHCRHTDSKDKCNGLVGQAAPIRALVAAATVLERPDARRTAEEVFRLHPFDEALGLWERVEIDGRRISFDRTLNHQIIFAAAAAELESETATARVERFLDRLERNMHQHPNGLIKHYARPPLPAVLSSVARTPRYYNMLVNEVAFRYYSRSETRRRKERGYQTVNLAALSELRASVPDHRFWRTEALADALSFVRDAEDELLEGIDVRHGHQLQGIAIAKIRHRFDGVPINDLRYLVRAELADDIGDGTELFEVSSLDENTRFALVSELTDLPNVEL